MLFDGHLGQGSAIIAFVTTDAELFDPLFLYIRLTALRTDKHASFIEHASLLFHEYPPYESRDRVRMAQGPAELQDNAELSFPPLKAT
jgi:hypothetical protein